MSFKLEKIGFHIIIMIVILSGTISHSMIIETSNNIESKNNTTSVFVEFFTKSSDKSTASISDFIYNLYSIKYDLFSFVTYVVDKNDKIRNRIEELQIQEFPAVVINGGYRYLYGEDITEKLEVTIDEASKLTVNNNISIIIDSMFFGQCPGHWIVAGNLTLINRGNIPYTGKIFLSIVEIDSRWNDKDKRCFTFTTLDFMINESISIGTGVNGVYDTYFDWNSAFAGYEDIKGAAAPNLLIIASVYTKEDNQLDIVANQHLIQGNMPDKPLKPIGKINGSIHKLYTYETISSDLDGDSIRYCWDWNGDRYVDEWTDYYPESVMVSINHSWDKRTSSSIRVRAQDSSGLISYWSNPLEVSIPKFNTDNPINQSILRMLERFPFLLTLLH